MLSLSIKQSESNHYLWVYCRFYLGFVVRHDVTIKVLTTDKIGILVDKLLGLGTLKLNKLEWKAFNEIDPEEKAIDEGIQQGVDLCKHIDRKMGEIISI